MDKPYTYQEFPKFKYHPELEAVIVHTPDEETALGDGWYNTPADFPQAEAEPQKKAARKGK